MTLNTSSSGVNWRMR